MHCGGGHNHRTGLFDAILIKDNHLALAAQAEGTAHLTPAEAVRRARSFVDSMAAGGRATPLIVEVEVDTFEQLAEVLPEQPDMVLLDNMAPAAMRKAAELRDRVAPQVELEASGGVNLETIAGDCRQRRRADQRGPADARGRFAGRGPGLALASCRGIGVDRIRFDHRHNPT